MTRSNKRYAGPPPRCPESLDDVPPQLTEKQLVVPTSELYSVALEEYRHHHHRSTSTPLGDGDGDADPVERFEPDPAHRDRPTPRHFGVYARERASIDWSYHVVPTKARQSLQDEIVSLVLGTMVKECRDAGDDEPCRVAGGPRGQAELGCQLGDCSGENGESDDGKPLALFTAGGMGAGKGHTLRDMLRSRRIRLPANTVWIDPDALSRLLPERPQYLAHSPETASSLLHPEASLLQEICAAVAKERKRSLVIDGSLTDCKWFSGFMKGFRESGYECEILFVSAPEATMLERAERRAKSTGRVTNPEAIKRSRIKSPECVSNLSKPSLVRRVRLIDNSDDSSETSARGPEMLYDSALDPVWPAPDHAPLKDVRDADQSGWVDAKGFVEGRLIQGEDGRVPQQGYPTVAGGYPTARAAGEPSHHSNPLPPPPLRPERSVRRPVGATPSPATIGGSDTGRFEGRPPPAAAAAAPLAPPVAVGLTVTGTDGRGGEGKNRRMVDQLNGRGRVPDSPTFSPNPSSPSPSPSHASAPQFGRLSPTTSRRFNRRGSHSDQDPDSDASTSSSRPHSPAAHLEPDESPALVVPSALQDAISAFSSAGKRANGRRGGLADQGIRGAAGDDDAKSRTAQQQQPLLSSALNPDEYPDTPAFREVNQVLTKVATDWPALARGTSVEDETATAAGGRGGEDFDPVSLALHLLDPASASAAATTTDSNGRTSHQSLSSFLRLKAELDHAIQSTLSPVTNPAATNSTTANAYRAYETSITTHNMTLGALGVAQKQIGGLKQGLLGTREMLEGRGREGLAGMYARMGMLEEMSAVLDEIDHLLRLPPSLESLLSEKRFLSAVVLLVRSIKTLNKPEMQEIGALADLRAWAQGQETVMLEILIEELHNHLYLKSFYCDVRWKSYTRGQSSLPVVDFGDDADVASSIPSHLSASFHSSGRSTARLPRMSKLERFLQSLALKPSSNPMLDEAVEELMLVADDADGDDAGAATTTGSFSFGAGETLGSVSTGGGVEGASGSVSGDGGGGGGSGGAIAGAGGAGGGGGGTGSSTTKTPRQQRRNPEVDSFGYLEMLMESLAALGKLGYALDAVGQRVQGEMFQLVENTVEEVEERNNDQHRGLVGGGGSGGGGAGGGGASQRPASSTFGVPASPDLSSTSNSTSAAAAAGSWATEGVASLLRLSASETSSLATSVETLRDLFWTLFSKLDAVLQGFRVTYEVAGRIAERRDFKDASIVKTSSGSLLFSLLDVWKPVQQEVRALLHDYLQDDQSGSVSSRNPIVSVNEVLRFPKPRDTNRQIFRFNDSDVESSSKALKPYEDSLNVALKSAVPGLITEGVNGGPLSTTTTSALIAASSTAADFSNGIGRASNHLNGTHKALVPADAFNVSVLFGPTLSFLERAKEVLPGGLIGLDDDLSTAGGTNGFGGFLDEFVLKNFLPQLETKVETVFHQAVGGIDAFQEDPTWKRVSRVPIVRSVSSLMLLISSLSSMLRATPFHRDNYSQLIVSVIHQFYQHCLERFKDLVSRDPPAQDSNSHAAKHHGQGTAIKTAAEWAGIDELYSVLSELEQTTREMDPLRSRELLAQESKLESDLSKRDAGRVGRRVAGTPHIEFEDLIVPTHKKLWALATLYSSLDWFVRQLSTLQQHAQPEPPTTTTTAAAARDGSFSGRARGMRESGYSTSSGDASPAPPPLPPRDGDERDPSSSRTRTGTAAGSPLTGDTTRPFDLLLRAYTRLKLTILFTLRIEIRLRTIYYLDKATRDGVYQLQEDVQEPDPSVVDLNGDLAMIDEVAAGTLGVDERKFVFEGLSSLMDQLLISNARQIRLANAFGLSKMNRNVLALQQNLKNIGDEPLGVDFDRSRKFWELFGKGPRAMLDEIQSGTCAPYGFTFDDYKTLLQLQLEIDPSGKDAGGATTTTESMLGAPMSSSSDKNRRAYGEAMIASLSLSFELFSLDNGNDGDD
ncbi:hypothetical protein JCM11491_006723 [Sporobolomyces phaffii]